MDSELEKPTTFKEGVAGVWRHIAPYKSLATAIAVLGVLSSAANGAVPYVTGRFFDALIALSQGQDVMALWGPPTGGSCLEYGLSFRSLRTLPTGLTIANGVR